MLRIAQEIANMVTGNQAYTDLNLRPGKPIFYRSPSGYKATSSDPLTVQDIRDFCELMDGKWEKKIEEGGGQYDCGGTIKGMARLRINMFRFGSDNHVGAVVRKLPVNPPRIDEIGVPFDIKRLIDSSPKGLILVTGPTGSGKSTTLAAIIEYLNETKPLSIVTIEQPIEYEFDQKQCVITQREVPTNVTSFEKGIESSKRQDPDVIMVGEVRNKGTVDAMLAAACSGHLVLATTHARSAQESCESVLSYYADEELKQKRSLLASSLLAINSQVLLPTADKKAFVLGYELMTNTPSIAQMIREGKTREIGTLMQGAQAATAAPLVSLNQRLVKMVQGNVIAKEEALAHAYDKEDLAKKLGPLAK